MNPLTWLRLFRPMYAFARAVAARDPRGMIEAGERALRIDPRSVSTLCDVAEAYAQLGDRERAVELWRRALPLDPSHFRTLRALGDCYVKDGETRLAREMLQRAIAQPMTPHRDWPWFLRFRKLERMRRAADDLTARERRDELRWRAWAERWLARHGGVE